MRKPPMNQNILACLLAISIIIILNDCLGNALSALLKQRMSAQAFLFVGELVQSSVIILVIGLFWRGYQQSPWQALGLQKSSQSHWLRLALGQGVLLFGAMLGLSWLSGFLFFPHMPPQTVTVVALAAQTWEKILLLLAAGFLAPVSEELLFRGLIYHTLRQVWRVPQSILTTAVIFGCMHLDIYRLVPLTISGIWLNILYVRTQSLYVSMVAHSVWNMLMLALIYWV